MTPPGEERSTPAESAPVEVHGLLICRRVERTAGGELTLHNVVEVLAVDGFPGDAGPIEFVALVRNLPPGQGKACFVVSLAGRAGGQAVARYPIQVNVLEAFRGRQLAIQLRVPSVPVARGGWYEVHFEWEGKPLASNRFAIGAKAPATPEATSGPPGG